MSIRRALGNMVGLAGVALLAIAIGATVERLGYQSWQNWAFEQQLHGEPANFTAFLHAKEMTTLAWLVGAQQKPAEPEAATAKPELPSESPTPQPAPAAPEGVVGRLTIPRLGLSAIVRDGDTDATLRVALGHIPSTAFPGQNGNVGIAGHRDTLFRQLRHLRKHDVIWVETPSGKYAYEVQSLQVVKPTDVAVLDPGPSPELTLVTCYPFTYIGAAPDRFIVHASQISCVPASQITGGS